MSTPSNTSSGSPRRRRSSLYNLIAVLFVSLTGLIVLTVLQRSLMYFPDRVVNIQPIDGGWPNGQVQSTKFEASDGLILHGWHLLPDGHSHDGGEGTEAELAFRRPVILYFQGNAGNRTYRSEEFQTFTRQGCDVFVFDYRGYGDNDGSPTEKLLVDDAVQAFDYLTRQRNIAAERIVVFGESLGGGVATQMAARLCRRNTPPAGLVVRSSFSSMVDAGSYHYPWLPVRWMLIDRYLSESHIRDVTCPILQIHGQHDRIVPLEIGRKLFSAAPESSTDGIPKRFALLDSCGHNDVVFGGEPEYSRAINEFLDTVVRNRARP